MYKVEYIVASTKKDKIERLEQKLAEMAAKGYQLVTMTGGIEIFLVFKKI